MPHGSSDSPHDLPGAFPTLLVGREAELRQLDGAVRRVAEGGFAVVEICGGPGLGKSRMLAELAVRARRAGLRVCSGTGTQFERGVPYGIFAEALQPLVEAADADPHPAGADPTPLRTLYHKAADLAAAPLADRSRIHNGIRRHLTGVALLLDDLHWTDPASVELAEYLLRKPPVPPVLVAVAVRAARAHPQLVDAVGRLGTAAYRMALPALTADDVAALLPDAPDRRRTQILAVSQGNPLYVHALAQLPDADLAHLADGREPEGHPVEGPQRGLLGYLAAEITSLDPPAQRVAHAAAVAGEHPSIELLAEVAQLPAETVVAAVDQMYQAGLVEPDGPWFRFRHPLLRSAALGLAGPAWRAAAHARAAAHIRQAGGPLHVLAHHTARSASPGDEAAAGTLVEAGSGLLRRAPAQAARWLGAALRILPAAGAWQDRRRTVLLRYAQALCLSGDLPRSWDMLQELLQETGLRHDDAVTFSAAVARMRGDLAEASAMLRARPGAGAGAGGAGGDTGPARETNLAEGRRQVELAAIAVLRADHAAGVDHAGQALRRLSPRQPVLRAAAESLAGWGALLGGQTDRARGHATRAAELADAATDRELLPRVELCGPLAGLELRLGRLAAAGRHLDRARAIVDRIGRSSALPYLLVVAAEHAARTGRLDLSLQHSEEAIRAARLVGSREMAAMADAGRIRPLLWARGPAAATAVGDRLTAAGQPRSHLWALAGRLDHALALAVAGDAGRCGELLGDAPSSAAEPVAGWPHDPYTEVTRYAVWAVAEARAGAPERARAHADRGMAIAEAAGLDYERGVAGYAAAVVAGRAGEAGRSAELAAAAIDRFTAAGAPLEQALARQVAGRAQLRAGRTEPGRAELARARAGYQACGAHWLLGANPAEAPAGPAPSGQDPLTARERQVADLVAQGLTNQEIATRLFLSRRTVESHVAHIFTKLEVRSRVSLSNLVKRGGH